MNRTPDPSPTSLPRRRFAAALTGLAAVAVLAVAAAPLQSRAAAEAAVQIPALAGDTGSSANARTETAVFAGGCFWGVQGVFQHTRGVLSAVSGPASFAHRRLTHRGTASRPARRRASPHQESRGRIVPRPDG